MKKNNTLLRICALMLAIVTLFTTFPQKTMAASVDATAISRYAQTVYTGPSTSYVSAGSISANERVEILFKERNMDWYHIQYTVTSTGKKKTGYVPASSLTSISALVYEEFFNGRQAMSNVSQTVWSCDSSSLAVNIGSIGANEGITLLESYGNVAYIEYSTSSGPKRGYLINPNINLNSNTSVARVKSNASLYFGNNVNGFGIIGSVSANEYVTVLAKSEDWVYVEYNTNKGRKRGYFSQGYLDIHISRDYSRLYFYKYNSPYVSIDHDVTVYAGPSTKYYNLGTLRSGTDHKVYFLSGDWQNIQYTSNGKTVSGYIHP